MESETLVTHDPNHCPEGSSIIFAYATDNVVRSAVYASVMYIAVCGDLERHVPTFARRFYTCVILLFTMAVVSAVWMDDSADRLAHISVLYALRAFVSIFWLPHDPDNSWSVSTVTASYCVTYINFVAYLLSDQRTSGDSSGYGSWTYMDITLCMVSGGMVGCSVMWAEGSYSHVMRRALVGNWRMQHHVGAYWSACLLSQAIENTLPRYLVCVDAIPLPEKWRSMILFPLLSGSPLYCLSWRQYVLLTRAKLALSNALAQQAAAKREPARTPPTTSIAVTPVATIAAVSTPNSNEEQVIATRLALNSRHATASKVCMLCQTSGRKPRAERLPSSLTGVFDSASTMLKASPLTICAITIIRPIFLVSSSSMCRPGGAVSSSKGNVGKESVVCSCPLRHNVRHSISATHERTTGAAEPLQGQHTLLDVVRRYTSQLDPSVGGYQSTLYFCYNAGMECCTMLMPHDSFGTSRAAVISLAVFHAMYTCGMLREAILAAAWRNRAMWHAEHAMRNLHCESTGYSSFHLASRIHESPEPFRLLDLRSLTVLEYHSGDEVPPYFAISHVWSKSTWVDKPEQASIAGVSWTVPLVSRHTLQAALDHVREHSLGMQYVWLDVFCLPQGDALRPQRDRELPYAHIAYSGASVCIVYPFGLLGRSDARIEDALESWALRVWTFQEFVVPPLVLVAMYGNHKSDYMRAEVLLRSLPRYGPSHAVQARIEYQDARATSSAPVNLSWLPSLAARQCEYACDRVYAGLGMVPPHISSSIRPSSSDTEKVALDKLLSACVGSTVIAAMPGPKPTVVAGSSIQWLRGGRDISSTSLSIRGVVRSDYCLELKGMLRTIVFVSPSAAADLPHLRVYSVLVVLCVIAIVFASPTLYPSIIGMAISSAMIPFSAVCSYVARAGSTTMLGSLLVIGPSIQADLSLPFMACHSTCLHVEGAILVGTLSGSNHFCPRYGIGVTTKPGRLDEVYILT